jgi:hypothetical protein
MACSLGLSQSKDSGRRGWSLSYDAVGSEFESVDGYVPETGVYALSGGVSGRTRTAQNESAEDVKMSWGLSGSIGHSREGRRSDVAGSTTLRLTQDSRLDLALDTGEHDNLADRTASVSIRRRIRDLYRQGSVTLRGGKRAGEDYGYLGLTQGFRPAPNLSAQLSAEHLSLAGPDGEHNTQLVATAAYDLTDEKTISSRLVVRNSEINLYLAYRQALRSGPDLFILLGDPNADRTTARLATKVVWPLLY